MTTGRENHTATLLADGRVLITGGTGGVGALQTAEIYDPATGTFSVTGNMIVPRWEHTATLLTNGKVLVAGGSTTGGHDTATAELYDPLTGSFAGTGDTRVHPFPTATLLPNGKVLLVGDASAELYDPGNGVFTSAGPLVSPRQIHTATLLANGTVLIAGGAGGTGLGLAPSTALAEIYDPATNSFAPTGSMEIGRLWHTATLLRDGSVLVAGGAFSGDGLHVAALPSAEIYK